MTSVRKTDQKWPEDCGLKSKELRMKAVIYDKVSLKFKFIVIAAIGVLATVIALGEMGII